MCAQKAQFAAVIVLAAIVSPIRAEVRFFGDATLRAAQFVDANEGWAVGDEGVIWHTVNGGKTWELQKSGVRGSLRSICFVLPFRGEGWVAGREELPQGGSVGVLLSTRDGGATWQRQLTNRLPGLNCVRFTVGDPRIGFLIGDGCDAFASGVFRTIDAGKNWEPVPGPRASTWFAGDFHNHKNGMLCGAWSRLANFEEGTFNIADTDRLDSRRALLGLQVLPQKILAVGQGGLIMSSVTRGRRWGDIDANLPEAVRANLDFHAIHAVGPKVWIAGRPGSFVLASNDQGTTWKMFKTGQNIPLHGLYFLDQRGWAVGDAGTILHTRDGGQTWQVQRQGGKRAAILCVHALPEKLDVDTVANLGGDDGYLTVALRCTVPVAGSGSNQATVSQRFAAGSRLAGGMTGETLWQFPLPQYLNGAERQRVTSYWNDLHDGDADRQVLRQLVLALRMWRPSIVIGDAPHPQISGSVVSSLMCEALRDALVQASDPKAFPEQIEQLGLQPWRVSRYYAGWTKKDADISMDSNRISGALEQSYRDFASPAARLLAEERTGLPLERYYRLLGSAPDIAEPRTHLLSGLTVPMGEARRELPRIVIGDVNLKKIRSLSKFILLAERLDKNVDQMLAQLGPMLDSVSEEQGLAAAMNLADHFVRKGQWVLARETYMLVVQKYPASLQSAEAYRWLIRHASSSEARRRHELGQFIEQTNVRFDLNELGKSPQEQGAGGPVAQVNFLNPNESRHWYRGSLDFGARLSAFGPMYAMDPAMQFCLQSSRRQLGEPQPVKEYFSKFVKHFPRGSWNDAASTELWLLGSGGDPARPIATCSWAGQKPTLDGDFDDPCWKEQKPHVLQNAAGDNNKKYATQARFAFDQEFLYVAIRCEHPADIQLAQEKTRTRDADLDAFDRVSIMLDLDRDYSTYFHLQIDQRGCVRDNCWGDVSWNPKWFLAVKTTSEAWCVEAAIPLHELTGERVVPGAAWAFNVVRILPGRGVQASSMPADVRPRPEGMGVMLFTEK